MFNHSIFRRFAILFVSIFTLTGCTAIQSLSSSAFLISPEQETQLGQNFAQEIEKQYPVYEDDPAATAYLNDLGQRLVKAAPPVDQKFQFHLVNTEDVNAFAIPGGHCYVHLGLLRAADNEAEFASVVAHEIGHVVARHGAKALSRSKFYNSLSSVALGQTTGQLTQMTAQVVESGILLSHSRHDELEADSIAVHALPKAGLDPNGLVLFFDKIGGGGQVSFTQKMSSYFSTHPLTPDRVTQAKQIIHAMPQDAWSEDSLDFRRVKARYPAKSQ